MKKIESGSVESKDEKPGIMTVDVATVGGHPPAVADPQSELESLESEKIPITIKTRKRGVGKPVDKAVWAEVKHAYMVKGIISPRELARIYNVAISAIYWKIKREKWAEELQGRYGVDKTMAMMKGVKDLANPGCIEKKDLAELTRVRREEAIRMLVDTTTGILKLVKTRMRTTSGDNIQELVKLTEVTERLWGMMQGLLGFGNMGKKDGKPVGADKVPAVQVNILAAVVEQADRIKSEQSKGLEGVKRIEESS